MTHGSLLIGRCSTGHPLGGKSRMSGDVQVRICERLGVRLPRATRLVILCPPGRGEAALETMKRLMSQLGLTVNEKKTRLAVLPQDTFDFLGLPSGTSLGTKVSPIGARGPRRRPCTDFFGRSTM